MLDNKKYLKDVSSMYSTAQRVKKYVVAELDKIDEKYRKIIAEEKKKLNEQLEVLNAQIKFYAGIVSPEETPAPEESEFKEEQTPIVEEEPVITDTIFPENNEPEDTAESAPVAKDAGEPAGNTVPDEPAPASKNLDAEEGADWTERIESGELKEVEQPEWTSTDPAEDWPAMEEPKREEEEEKKEPVLVTDDESGWPEFPAEWK